ncbi:hypothetical protein AWW66_01205 [Micromonospora rosaria]|uniref:Cupin type-2 domain-containing protein n=1 Tax=Micromonospora rosaria TaxID=47874 RepID=A0A136Q045_9ACTN|nr:cupin domain-containing protein [Micromonospora rosaria]KXK63826.1 hypothetical protein AWW66_01205 [Micromonospora rosaria]
MIRKVSLCDTPADHRRGGTINLLLSPRSVGATSGFMGVGRLEPGEYVIEHYHPYSEEFVYVVEGELHVRAESQELTLRADDSLLIPVGVRHRFENRGDVPARVVFHNGPLAPRPDLGHVDVEEPLTEGPPPQVGGPVRETGGVR